MWYVIQVINGREDAMRERIERMVPESSMQELFYPQYQTEIKVHGEWVSTTKPLFPGYLICDTADPRAVQQYLLRMDDFARVLSQDGQFVPLAKEETQLIGSFTNRGDRVVPMSEALKDGDQVVVTAGPLLGHEGLIKTINRRKSTARPTRNHPRWPCGAFKRAARYAQSQKSDFLAASSQADERRQKVSGEGLLEPTMMTMAQGARETRTAATANSVTAAAGAAGDYLTNEEAYKMLRGANSGVKPELGHRLYRVVKRTVDIVAAGGALVLLFIPGVILIVVICIKSPGASPLYSQWRVGRVRKDGTFYLFKIYKFRSMVPNADQMLKDLQAQNEATGPMFKMKHDPRIIPGVGNFIRKHSIDELPQLINVFLGQMNLIGPRPGLPREVALYSEHDMKRLAVKPGCSGPWQVMGRSYLGFNEMVELDLRYIENRSLRQDLRLIFGTLKTMFSGEGAV